jgi:hypothetical protein
MVVPAQTLSRAETPTTSLAMRWHRDLSALASEEKPSDPCLAAAKMARIHVALLSLVPTICSGRVLGPLKPMSEWVRASLMDASVDSLHYLAGGQVEQGLQRIYQCMADAQAEFTAEVTSGLRARGILPLVFKGAELRARVFSGQAISSSTDVDMLVHPSRIEDARSALHEMGFVHAGYDPVNGCIVEQSEERVSKHEEQHRELYPLCRLRQIDLRPGEAEIASRYSLEPLFIHEGRGLMMEVIDLHRGLFARMEVDSLFERAVPSVFPGAVTLSTADHVWTGALRFYLESSAVHNDPKQRDLAYLAALLMRQDIDWPVLVDLIAKADLRPALFYTLRLLDRLQVARVPAWVLDALHVRRGSHYMDFGCRATRMLGLVEGFAPELEPLSR